VFDGIMQFLLSPEGVNNLL
jgi:hypothetical protein